ncbi:hypothetical protein [Caldiplasma sukawensis]
MQFNSTERIYRYNIYDQMKHVIIDHKIKGSEVTFNPNFNDFLQYYGIVIKLYYLHRSETNRKIKNNIKTLRYNFFNGRIFSYFDEVNT